MVQIDVEDAVRPMHTVRGLGDADNVAVALDLVWHQRIIHGDAANASVTRNEGDIPCEQTRDEVARLGKQLTTTTKQRHTQLQAEWTYHTHRYSTSTGLSVRIGWRSC